MSTKTSEVQFVAMAAAEKLVALDTEEDFDGRAARADLAAFDRIMSSESPRGDLVDRSANILRSQAQSRLQKCSQVRLARN